MSVPSVTALNVLNSSSPGYRRGLGVKAVIVPDVLAAPAASNGTELKQALKDLSDGNEAGGNQDTATAPFAGMRFPVGKTVTAFAEAAFVGGYQYSAGIQMLLGRNLSQ